MTASSASHHSSPSRSAKLVAMALAQTVLTSISGLVATIYYVVAGLGWVLPAMPLIKWMSRPDEA